MDFGFQLSSVAPYLKTAEEMEASLARLAEIGWRNVQLQGVPAELPDQAVAAALRKNGLRCVAVQEDYPFGYGKEPERGIARALACGAGYYVFALIPPTVNSPEQMKYFAEQVYKLYRKVREAGLRFAFHPVASDFRMMWNVPVYQRLLELLPEDVQLTLCVYHTFGKASYAEILEKYAGRCDLVHFKDAVTLSNGSARLTPLGEGEHNWKPILHACEKAGVKYVFAEQENWDRDPFDCAKASCRYLQSLGANL